MSITKLSEAERTCKPHSMAIALTISCLQYCRLIVLDGSGCIATWDLRVTDKDVDKGRLA